MENLKCTRRGLLASLGATAVASYLPFCACAAPVKGQRIDVHHHIVSPDYSAALKQRGLSHIAWSAERSLTEMDTNGISTALTSQIQPGVWFGDVPLGRKLARGSNEFAVRLAADNPGRFGTFATLPYPDTEGSLSEIEYALESLKVQGFGLMTSYEGRYLGDPAFWPVLEELNRRHAVVYVHPVAPQCCSNIASGVVVGVIEYATDTTRTMASLVFTGATSRFPDIKWIFSHSGGTTPFLVSRLLQEEKVRKGELEAKIPKGVMFEMRKFHYDTAQGNHEGALAALLKMVPVSQLLYGTDYPYRGAAEETAGLGAYGFSGSDLRAIERGNALALIPRLNRS